MKHEGRQGAWTRTSLYVIFWTGVFFVAGTLTDWSPIWMAVITFIAYGIWFDIFKRRDDGNEKLPPTPDPETSDDNGVDIGGNGGD